MKSKRIRTNVNAETGDRNQLEADIQKDIIKMLFDKGWYCRPTHGNMYQMGFPDLYACHIRYGARWIEVKNPEHYSFTPAQLEVFREFAAKQVGVWILVAATEFEYEKLFQHYNWWSYVGRASAR